MDIPTKHMIKPNQKDKIPVKINDLKTIAHKHYTEWFTSWNNETSLLWRQKTKKLSER